MAWDEKLIQIKSSTSNCENYRWTLDLNLSDNEYKLIFIGLNPSLSNSYFLDNTTKKIIHITEKNNYGKLTIINLFAVISKDPKILFSHEDPVGTHNDMVIKKSIKFWSQNFKCNLWLGWGNNGTFLERNKYAYKLIRKHFNSKKSNFKSSLGPLLIRKTKLNQPMHPLYCRNNSNLIEDISFI